MPTTQIGGLYVNEDVYAGVLSSGTTTIATGETGKTFHVWTVYTCREPGGETSDFQVTVKTATAMSDINVDVNDGVPSQVSRTEPEASDTVGLIIATEGEDLLVTMGMGAVATLVAVGYTLE